MSTHPAPYIKATESREWQFNDIPYQSQKSLKIKHRRAAAGKPTPKPAALPIHGIITNT